VQPLASSVRRWIFDFGIASAASPPSQPPEEVIETRREGSQEVEEAVRVVADDDMMKQSLDTIKTFTPNSSSSNLSKAQLKEFREAFGFFDKDGDGYITTEELGIVMRSLGQFASEEELKEMLKEVDINGDGLFSLDEFVEIVSNYSGPTVGNSDDHDEEQELRDAFRIFDKHSRGFISASDLRAVLHCLGEDLSEDEIEDMIREVDIDGDGRIDFEEFVRALGEPEEPEDDQD